MTCTQVQKNPEYGHVENKSSQTFVFNSSLVILKKNNNNRRRNQDVFSKKNLFRDNKKDMWIKRLTEKINNVFRKSLFFKQTRYP